MKVFQRLFKDTERTFTFRTYFTGIPNIYFQLRYKSEWVSLVFE